MTFVWVANQNSRRGDELKYAANTLVRDPGREVFCLIFRCAQFAIRTNLIQSNPVGIACEFTKLIRNFGPRAGPLRRLDHVASAVGGAQAAWDKVPDIALIRRRQNGRELLIALI